MPSIQIFDPALCCSTGVCGVEVDQNLVSFAADVGMRPANPPGVRHGDRSQWRACDQARQFETRISGSGGAASSAVMSRAVLGFQFQGSIASRSRLRAVGMRCSTSVM